MTEQNIQLDLTQKIEALLFVESKPFSFKKIAKLTGESEDAIAEAAKALQVEYDTHKAGVRLVVEGTNVQLMTAPEQAEFIAEYLNAEQTGELTRPSMETLTIIAYRGPVSKAEIELIRGINCSVILRNLLMRGLAEDVGETETGSPVYRVTLEFLRFLGVNKVEDLPNYEELNENVHLQELLEGNAESGDFFAGSGKGIEGEVTADLEKTRAAQAEPVQRDSVEADAQPSEEIVEDAAE